jgi:hypothetical protein
MGAKGLAFSAASKQLLVADFFNMRIRGIHPVNGSSADSAAVPVDVGAVALADTPQQLGALMPPSRLNAWTEENLTAIVQAQVSARAAAAADVDAVDSQSEGVGRSTAGGAVRVLLWTGHSGPYHDHFINGAAIAEYLNATGNVTVVLPCRPDESTPCEAVFADPDLGSKYDVILVNADTYVGLAPSVGALLVIGMMEGTWWGGGGGTRVVL